MGEESARCRHCVVALLEQELQTLFGFKRSNADEDGADDENALAEPLVLSEQYSTGFVQIMQKQFLRWRRPSSKTAQ